MKKPALLAAALPTLAALTAVAAAAFATPAGGPKPVSSGQGQAMRVIVGGLKTELPSFTADPPGAEATPAPKPDEWKSAPSIKLDHDVDGCKAFRVREWVKIHCTDFPAAAVSLLAGTRTGVEMWVDQPKEPKEPMKTPRSAQAIFPVRRGDGRILQIGQFGEGYDGPIAWNLAFTISEQWIEGEKAPIITVR